MRRPTRKRLLLLLAGAALVVIISGCGTARTTPATNVTATTATLNGTGTFYTTDYGEYFFEYSSDGGVNWTGTAHYAYGIWPNNAYCNNGNSNGGSEMAPVNVSQPVGGLSPSTHYVYRLVATVCGTTRHAFDSAGPDVGGWSSFDTQALPAAPTVTGTDPASPAAYNSPKIKGTAPAGTTVKIYANAGCTGSPLATGTAAAFASPGIQVTVGEGTTTTFRATATNSSGTSACSSTSTGFAEQSVSIPAGNLIANPSFETNYNGWESEIPGNLSATSEAAAPAGQGIARVTLSAGSGAFSIGDVGATVPSAVVGTPYTARAWVRGEGSNIGKELRLKVREYDGPTYIGATEVPVTLTAQYQPVEATYTATGNGRQIEVQIFRPTAASPVLNESFYVDAVSLTAGTPVTPPAAPTFTGTDPVSPAAHNAPKIKGTAPAGTTVKLYTTSNCTGAIAATGTAAAFASPGLAASVGESSTTTFRATATDGSGTSACSPTSVSFTEQSVQLPSGNLSGNPSFEANGTGWEISANATLAAPSADVAAPIGQNAAKLTMSSGSGAYSISEVGNTVTNAVAGTPYTAKAYVKGEGSNIGKEIRIKVREWSSDGSTYIDAAEVPVTLTGQYQPVEATYTATGNGNKIDIQVFRPSSPAPGPVVGEAFYLDAFSLVAGAAPPGAGPPGGTIVGLQDTGQPSLNPLTYHGGLACANYDDETFDPVGSAIGSSSTGGDTHPLPNGQPQGDSYYRYLTAVDNTNSYGERCELGRGDRNSFPSPPTPQPPLYEEGEHLVTWISLKLPSTMDLNTEAWQGGLQMKQTNPSDLSVGGPNGDTPVLSLGVSGGSDGSRWRLNQSNSSGYSEADHEIWTTPAQNNVWTRFAFDVTYSTNPSIGRLKVYADLNNDNDFMDDIDGDGRIDEQSDASPGTSPSSYDPFQTYTLKIEGPNVGANDGPPEGSPLPSSFKFGVYHNQSAYSCPPPPGPGCSIHVDNIEVVQP